MPELVIVGAACCIAMAAGEVPKEIGHQHLELRVALYLIACCISISLRSDQYGLRCR